MPDTETDSLADHFDEYTGKARNKTEVQFKLRTQLFNRKLMASFNKQAMEFQIILLLLCIVFCVIFIRALVLFRNGH